MKTQVQRLALKKWHLNNDLVCLPSRDQLSQWMSELFSPRERAREGDGVERTMWSMETDTLQMMEADGFHDITLSPPFQPLPQM